MTAKDFLRQNRWIHLRLQTTQDRLEELRAVAEKSTTTLTGMPKAKTTASNLPAIVAQIADLEEGLERDRRRLMATRAAIVKAIRDVPDPACELVLEYRYLAFLPWQAIADTMGYETRQVLRIHGRALQMVVVPENVSHEVAQCRKMSHNVTP